MWWIILIRGNMLTNRKNDKMNDYFSDIIGIEKYSNVHYGKKLLDWY